MNAVSMPLSRRGRKPKYRDLSQKKEGARLRKERQRERERAEGLRTIEVRVPDNVLTSLARTAAFTFADPKALAAQLVASTIGRYTREIEQLSQRAGQLWLKVAPAYRKSRTMPAARSDAIAEELESIRHTLAGFGWTRDRADRFIRRSGERAFLDTRARDGGQERMSQNHKIRK